MSEFLDFFLSLTKGVKAALPYFRAVAETDASVNVILQTARDLGFKFREQQARDVISVLRGNFEQNQNFQRLQRIGLADKPLDPKTYVPKVGKTLNNFGYVVRRQIVGRESGQGEVDHVTIISNDPLSVNQILDTAKSYLDGSCNPLMEPADIVEMNVIEAYRSPYYEV